MIIEENPTWLRLVFKVQGSALPRIWLRLAFITSISVVFTFLQRYEIFRVSLSLTPFLIVGLPLGIILGFRNSSAYDRYWEGRRLWGSLVNVSRTYTRQIMTLIVPPADAEGSRRATELQHTLILFVVAFAHALRMQLRGQKRLGEIASLLPPEDAAKLEGQYNPAAWIVHRAGERLAEARRAGWIDPFHVPVLEQSFTQMIDVQGGCERIKSTPTPLGYAIFIHRAVAAYCFLLPFGIEESVHALTPIVVFFVAYAFFSLDAIGTALDDPFRLDRHHLPLSAISRSIEIYVRQRLGETQLPEPLTPEAGVLD
jgi:ion channel-forming bestrophin family protein